MNDEITGVDKQSYNRKVKQPFGFVIGQELNSALHELTIYDIVKVDGFGENYRVTSGSITKHSVSGPNKKLKRSYGGKWKMTMVDVLLAFYKGNNVKKFASDDIDSTRLEPGSAMRKAIKSSITREIRFGPNLNWERITPRQHLYVWLQAHDQGLLPVGDPVPRPALIGAALEQELISESELIENKTLQRPGKSNITLDYGLPNEVYNETVRQFKSAYNWSPGRNILITEADIQVAEVNSEVAAKVFGALYLTTDPREFETPFDTPRERVENVWKVFNVFLEINDVEPVSPTNPHNPPKQEFINAFPEAEKKSTPWYPGASSAPQLYVGARLNDVGRWLALKHDIELDDWD